MDINSYSNIFQVLHAFVSFVCVEKVRDLVDRGKSCVLSKVAHLAVYLYEKFLGILEKEKVSRLNYSELNILVL